MKSPTQYRRSSEQSRWNLETIQHGAHHGLTLVQPCGELGLILTVDGNVVVDRSLSTFVVALKTSAVLLRVNDPDSARRDHQMIDVRGRPRDLAVVEQSGSTSYRSRQSFSENTLSF